MPGEHLEQTQLVLVELVEAELRDDDHADHGRPVEEWDGEQRLLDPRGPSNLDAELGLRRVAREERLARLGDMTGDALADPGLQHLHRRARRDKVTPEGDRPQIVPVTDEDAAVVVIDQEPQLLGDRGADLGNVVEAAQLRRYPVEQLQVGDRADLGAPVDVLLGGSFGRPVLEDHDLAPAAGLRGHHRHLGAGDELARIRRVLRARGDPDREADGADRAERHSRDLLSHPLGKAVGLREAARGRDDRELLAADPADGVAAPDGAEEDLGDLREHLVSGCVAVDVVDALEVVEVEHHEGDGGAIDGGLDELEAETLVERTVVPETRERIGLRLSLERRADVRVVERQGCGVAESDDEQELVLRELLEAGAIDVECPLQLAPGDQRDDDQRLGIGRRVDDEADAGVELRSVREHGLAVLDRPARDADAEGERWVGQHLGGVLPGRVDGLELAGGLVRLVERDVVARNQLPDRVRDPMEQVVERLLGQQLVEDVCELSVRLDERLERHVGDGLVVVRGRGVRQRLHGLTRSIGAWRSVLESSRLTSRHGHLLLAHGAPRHTSGTDRPVAWNQGTRGAPGGGCRADRGVASGDCVRVRRGCCR